MVISSSKGKVFEEGSGKLISRFGITSKNIDEFEVGEIAVFTRMVQKFLLMRTGNYFWRSKEKFTKKKGKRIFVSATSPPSFTLDNYKEVLLREG